MLMTASLLIPVIALSLFPHQEARFLIPITLPLVFLHAQEIKDMDSRPALIFKKQESVKDDQKQSKKGQLFTKSTQTDSKSLINLWIIFNCLLAIFFGFLHQGGIYPLTAHLKEIMSKQTKTEVVHLVTTYMYPIPQSLLVQRSSHHQYFDPVTKTKYVVARKFHAYELGSRSLPEVADVIKKILNDAETKRIKEKLDYKVYLALPSTLIEGNPEMQMSNLTFVRESVFYPHLSTEAPPHLNHMPYNLAFCQSDDCHNQTENDPPTSVNTGKTRDGSQEGTNDSFTSQIFYLLGQLSLSLYHVKV